MTASRRRAAMLGLAWTLVAGACAFRWWLQPQRAAAARASTPELDAARTGARERLRAAGIALALDDARAHPSWRAPTQCIEVYELRIDEQFRDASVASFVGRGPEHSRWTLSLARGRGPEQITAVLAPVDAGTDSDSDSDSDARERELWWSSRELGPAAPDFACRRRSWDPLEDALALGWPTLPDRTLHVGDTWRGASVEGRCHETVCLDEHGSFAHAQPCRARPWHEQLAGAGGGVMVVLGRWDDGHDPARPEIGILTQRLALIDDGRPLLVRAEIDQRWSGVQRSLELLRIDDCSQRSLADPAHAAVLAQARARLSAPGPQPQP